MTDEEAGPTELGRVARPSRGMKEDLAEVAEGQYAQDVAWRGMQGRRWQGWGGVQGSGPMLFPQLGLTGGVAETAGRL